MRGRSSVMSYLLAAHGQSPIELASPALTGFSTT
jgi:hypothetical protein